VKESSSAGTDTSEVGTRVRRAEAAFDRLLEKMTGVSVGSGSVEVSANSKLQELEQLTRTNRIKERLAATKAALGQEE
jgi:phage shock protein A